MSCEGGQRRAAVKQQRCTHISAQAVLREAVQQEAVFVLRVRLALRRAAVRELELRQGRLVLLDELLERRLVALQAVSAAVLLCSRLAAHLDLQDLGLAVLDALEHTLVICRSGVSRQPARVITAHAPASSLMRAQKTLAYFLTSASSISVLPISSAISAYACLLRSSVSVRKSQAGKATHRPWRSLPLTKFWKSRLLQLV